MSGSPLQCVMTMSPTFVFFTAGPTAITSPSALLPGKILPPRTSAMFCVSASAAWSTLCSTDTARMRSFTSAGPSAGSATSSSCTTREMSNLDMSPPTRSRSLAMLSLLIEYACGMSASVRKKGAPCSMRAAPDAISPLVPSLRPAELVGRLGPHPCAQAGLDLSRDADLLRWLALALLLSTTDEARALAALGALPQPRAGADVAAVAAGLTRARVPRPEAVAATLARAAQAFDERWGGSFAHLASGADDLETLGSRLAALAPGVGRATVLRFLRPLRELHGGARDVPLAPAAR